ncbi:MAG TPA: plastocyanin/azurin family copper-binding protein [Solirubrobacteraceae bacterium]|nr:plastocyanin/azurin family copper-binding protein [Solirubrobacteraceae bacterium]
MKRAATVLAACAVVALTAGCGSSKSNGSTSASTTTAATSAAGTTKSGVTANGKINYASPPANAPVQSGLVKIAYHEISIEPDTLKVKVGSTIEWTNHDPVEHNVTSASGPVKFASKNFGEGGTFRVKVTKAGVIHYRCTLHPATMNGAIEVVS